MPPDPKPPTPLSTDAAVASSPTRRAPDHDHGYELLFSHAEMVRDLQVKGVLLFAQATLLARPVKKLLR